MNQKIETNIATLWYKYRHLGEPLTIDELNILIQHVSLTLSGLRRLQEQWYRLVYLDLEYQYRHLNDQLHQLNQTKYGSTNKTN